MEGLTVKQIAELIDQPKQRTYRAIKKLNIQPLTNDKNRALYSADIPPQITAYLATLDGEKSQETAPNAPEIDENSAENEAINLLIDQLKRDIIEPQEQIKQLQERIRQLEETIVQKDAIIHNLSESIKATAESLKATEARAWQDRQQLFIEAQSKRWHWPWQKRKKDNE